MIYKIADNITSPLGVTTEENYQAIKAGRSALKAYVGYQGIPEPFTASLFTEQQKESMAVDGLTRFESMVIASAGKAIHDAGIDVSDQRTILILSTTKGNVELLSKGAVPDREFPGVCAQRIADVLGFRTVPIVVCNACISGLSAIILAMRLLDHGDYDYAVVSGADSQTPFIISGFQSLKALSPDECRPFDMERTGLNLGEASATMVFSSKPASASAWSISSGCVRNDAFHVSAPARDGEGARLVLQAVTEGRDSSDIAFVNAHGTATMFNDQMESVAIARAGLSDVPVNGLKGYYGHTMGAAGILETIISMRAADDHLVIGTRGFLELGVSGKILLSPDHQPATGNSFVKMLSGFGGCNAAIWAEKGGTVSEKADERHGRLSHHASLTPAGAIVDGQRLEAEDEGKGLLTALYKKYVSDYPKFYKMDMLSRLGFLTSELLLDAEGCERFVSREDRAVILFNRSSSVCADQAYLASIADPECYFPSPSVFVYTLPNIVTGEVAIRNNYHGETSFYVMPERNDERMRQVVKASLADKMTKSVIYGWLDYRDDQHFEADLYLMDFNG